MESDNWSYQGCKALAKAVIVQYELVWVNGSQAEWEYDKERFLAGDNAVWFWYCLAERIDLFDRMVERYRSYTLELWRKTNPKVCAVVIGNQADLRLMNNIRSVISRSGRRPSRRLGDPWIENQLGRMNRQAVFVWERESKVLTDVSFSDVWLRAKYGITSRQQREHSHPIYEMGSYPMPIRNEKKKKRR